jgi:putative chitinase
MTITSNSILQKCLPHATPANIEKYGAKLIEAMAKYNISTNERQAAFIAQLAHESGSLRYSEEIASGEAYEGRESLGNTQPGDGKRFKGRGLIQITGRTNYQLVSKALKYDFQKDPEALEKPGPACFSAAWFWHAKGLNRLADIEAFEKITRRINGGVTGMEDRLKHWETAKKALKVHETKHDSPRNIDSPLPS